MNLKWIGVPLRLLTEKGRVPKRQSAKGRVPTSQWVGPNLIFIQDSDEGTV